MNFPPSATATLLGTLLSGSTELRFECHKVGFTLAAHAFLKKMGVAEHIDRQVAKAREEAASDSPTGGQGWFEPTGPSVGSCVEAMVLNVLDGRRPLDRIGAWLNELPVALMWGSERTADEFEDMRLARSLDALWGLGLDEVFAPLVVSWKPTWNLSFGHLHSDGSTIPLQGAYEVEPNTPGPCPLRGYSKDNDRRNVQLTIGMTVQGEGIPLRLSMHDGNTSDTVLFRSHVEKIAALLGEASGEVFVGDSKLYDAETLGGLRDQGLHALTLMPRTVGARAELIRDALSHRADWAELHRPKGRTKREPDAVYQGWASAFEMPLVSRGPGNKKKERTERWGALVVHSSELETVHRAQDEKDWVAEGASWRAKGKALYKEEYGTAEEADRALTRALTVQAIRANGWIVCGEVERCEESLPRPRAGRPRKGESVPIRILYRVRLSVREDEPQRDAARQPHGLFVLVGSRPRSDSWTDKDLLLTYREKNGVEEGFRWIKAPGQVAPVFLHTPHRIAALGLVFVIALALWRLLQREIRQALATRGEVIPGHNGTMTDRPTPLILQRLFERVEFVTVRTGRGRLQVMQGVTELHRHILSLLGLSPNLYDIENAPAIGTP